MKPEKQLYQWDVNQYLTGINPAAQYVDYTIGNEVIRLETDGTRCRIPDEVLQTYGGKTCYERYPDGTYRAYSFSVLYAPKPPDYVYTPEERTTFEALTARVDAAIDEIKRRADSGEFTPKKGVDYFTESEKNEMMQRVSDGAIGEFREVVDTATTEYNDNHNLKLAKYNANASEKLTTYDTNAEQNTIDYNRNAAEKLKAYNDNHTEKMTAYDTNATDKLSTYNSNAEQKLEAYNQNHAAKVAEYNQNAETKTAEFDSNAAALQTEVDRLRGECDQLAAEKANIDGYYEEMTVGDAEQLVATQFVEDNEPYMFRPTGGYSDVGNRAYLDKIVGGTVAWNQLVIAMRGSGSEKGLTFTRNDDGSLNISGTITEAFSYDHVKFTFTKINFKRDGRKYLLMLNKPIPYAWGVSGYGSTISANSIGGMWSNNQGTDWVNGIIFRAEVGTTIDIQNLRAMVFDLSQMFGTTIADYIYSLEQATAGAGVAWFKKLFPKDYYPYNAGELLSVEGLQSHDSVGFNQWDEEWEVGDIGANTGEPQVNVNVWRSKNFIRIMPSASYYVYSPTSKGQRSIRARFYDANQQFIGILDKNGNNVYTERLFIVPDNAHYMKFAPANTDVPTHELCINLSDPSRNGEYEEYVKHSYPLDSSLTLRGIPKLDSSNNLYYDGDEYTSDDKVKRKYGVVDLGTLNWIESGDIQADGQLTFKSEDLNALIKLHSDFSGNAVCNRFTLVKTRDSERKPFQFTIGTVGTAYPLCFTVLSTFAADPSTFKSAVSGTKLVYELATPTTETAEPFQNIQIVDDFGTEEFVNTGIVPVGHKTRYPANLRDKIQHLPDLASMDGTYLIQQSGKQMSLVYMPAVFPETPTEDGTYTLKTVVTGGVATIQWVAE